MSIQKEKLLPLWMLYMPLKGREETYMGMIFKDINLIILINYKEINF